MRFRFVVLGAGSALLLTGCLAKSLSAAGAEVVTTSQAPRSCERIGDVAGSSGGALRGDMSSVRDLELGARNDLRNRAAELGADTVQIVRREGVTPQTFAGHASTSQVRYTGVAWRCGRR
jgi:hypothetical protein